MFNCPRCGYPGKDPRAVRAGSLGGLTKGKPKGFSLPEVRAKALAARKRVKD